MKNVHVSPRAAEKRAYYLANIEWFRERDRKRDWKAIRLRRRKTREYLDRETTKARASRHAKNRRARYPEKAKAQQLLSRAVVRREVVRPTICERCGKVDPRAIDGRTLIHGHHPDYSKPLIVQWVCPPCHTDLHRALSTPPKETKENPNV